MKDHLSHFAICGIALAVGLVLTTTGTSALSILPGIACLMMMVLMMWGMSHMRHRGH